MKIYHSIIEGVNEVLKETIHSYVNGDTSTINLFNLANIYNLDGNDTTAPMVNTNGELTYILDLDYPILGYHKLNISNFKIAADFGSSKQLIGNNSIDFIVIGKRVTLNTEPETLALAICSQLLDTNISIDIMKSNLQPISFITDPISIIKQEFNSQDGVLKYNNPDYFFIKVNYSLILELKPQCLTCK